jgi:hypothetical protein
MYGMSGPELLTQLKVQDTLRNAERNHRVSGALAERKAARHMLFKLNVARFWRRQAAAQPSLQPRSSG